MSLLRNTILSASNAGYLGSVSPYGDPRDVYINGVNDSLLGSSGTVQKGRYQYGNVVVGGFRNDYLTAYNARTSNIDILMGGAGADKFVAGDRFGIHYLKRNSIALVADYKYLQGDVIQLSSRGRGRYTWRRDNFGLGSAQVQDMVWYYNNKPVMAIVDAPIVNYVWG